MWIMLVELAEEAFSELYHGLNKCISEILIKKRSVMKVEEIDGPIHLG